MYTFRGLIGHCFMRLCSLLQIKNKAVFISFGGKSYSDSPRAIYEEMQKQGIRMEYIWLMNDATVRIPGVTVVRTPSLLALFHLATAKLWVDNLRKSAWLVKRNRQYYVQTWHGDVCIKMIEKDAEQTLSKSYVESAKHDSEMADLMLSGSNFRSSNYKSAFWYSGEILEEGTPQSVIYYQEKTDICERVFSVFGLNPQKTKIALYCPTFRADENLDVYNIDYARLIRTLESNWGGSWVVIIKLHPNIMKLQEKIIYQDSVINGSSYSSVDELIIASDLLITDYSSCMFQGLEAHKRVILYTSDLKDYVVNERKLYFDIRKLPFPLAENNDELCSAISEFDDQKYKIEEEKLREDIGFLTDIKSTERIVQYIVKKIGGTVQ